MNSQTHPDERLLACLQSCEPNFDSQRNVLKTLWKESPGYHTTLPVGVMVCSTKDNLTYALALLASGSDSSIRRAESVVSQMLELQDRDSSSPTYGIWPWFADEPLTAMRPPDWNWADFCGIRLAHILNVYGCHLAGDLQKRIKSSLRAAAYSIFRRNVGPGYTNIAIKGAVVCAVAGEVIGDDLLVDYARRRLQNFLSFTEEAGGFNEYNSPPYGVLVLTEVERGLLMIKDGEIRKSLRCVHELCWSMFAATLHLPTGQICGPQTRAYHDLLTADMIAILEVGLGLPLFRPSLRGELSFPGVEQVCLIPRVLCSDTIKERLFRGTKERFERHDFHRSTNSQKHRSAAVWMTEHACLGSMNVGTFWTQQHAIAGYWRTGESVAVVRVRFQRNGRDFASAVVRTSQEMNELLAGISLSTNKGDFHDHLDRPSGGRFETTELCLVIEVLAQNARAEEKGPGVFLLSAGEGSLLACPVFSVFDGHPIQWKTTSSEGRAALVATLHEGESVIFCPEAVNEFALGLYLAVVCTNEIPAKPTLRYDVSDDEMTFSSGSTAVDLKLSIPRKPIPFV